MKSLKYEGVIKLKIFWSLRRLEASLSGFKIKRVHYGRFGLQIIIYHPYYTKPNKAFSSLITPKPDLHPPSLSNPSPFSSLRLLLRFSSPTAGGGGWLQRRRGGPIEPPPPSSISSSPPSRPLSSVSSSSPAADGGERWCCEFVLPFSGDVWRWRTPAETSATFLPSPTSPTYPILFQLHFPAFSGVSWWW